MKSLLILFIILLLAIGIGWGMRQDSGDVLIRFKDWQFESSVWFALLLIVIGFIIIYILIRLLSGMSHLPRRWRIWRHTASLHRGQRYLDLAGCEYIEEKWEIAEKYFEKAAQHLEKPMLGFVGAAMAAQKQNAYGRRNDYLQKAYQSAPNAEISLGFLQAKMEIDSQQWDEAQDTLKKLSTIVPQHPLLENLLRFAFNPHL
jgi:HemY protein